MGIQGLLERYKNLRRPDETVRLAVQRLLKELCGVAVGVEDIELRRGVVHIRAHPVLKTEIALVQKKLLKRLKEEMGESAPTRVV